MATENPMQYKSSESSAAGVSLQQMDGSGASASATAGGAAVHEVSLEDERPSHWESGGHLSHERVSEDPEMDKIFNVRVSGVDGKPLLREAEIFGSYVNLANSVIGSGILGLPYAFAASGFVLGTFLIVIAACATTVSLHMLTLCSLKVKFPASFFAITEASVPSLVLAIDIAVASMTFFGAASYLIVIGGLMPDVAQYLGSSSFWGDREIWVFLGFLIVAPISCLKSLDALKYTSAAAVFFVMFIALLVFTYAVTPSLSPCGDDATDDKSCTGSTELVTFDVGTFKSLGVFIFAYSCQMNIFPVVNELKNPTVKRFGIVNGMAISTAMLLYLLVAISGYSLYGDNVESNVLISFPDTDTTTCARIFVSLLVAFSYPLLCNPGRTSMISLWNVTDKGAEVSEATKEFRFYTCTAVFTFGTLGLALLLSDLGVVLDLIGATGATMITFILPGAAYYVMHPEGTGPSWLRTTARAYFYFGCFIMPFCLAFIFIPG